MEVLNNDLPRGVPPNAHPVTHGSRLPGFKDRFTRSEDYPSEVTCPSGNVNPTFVVGGAAVGLGWHGLKALRRMVCRQRDGSAPNCFQVK